MAQYIDAAEVARMIRKTLKIEFPSQKFYVRTSKYSMGASVNIKWQDGPTTKQVDDIVKFYEGSHFDGMIDLKTNVYHTTEAGEQIHYMSDHVFTDRKLSADHVRPFADWVVTNYALHTDVHSTGERIEDYDYQLTSSVWDKLEDAGFSFMARNNAYFGRQSFGEVVLELAHSHATFDGFLIAEAQEEQEREESFAAYQAEKAQEQKWNSALEEATQPQTETKVSSDYEDMLRAAGWID